MHTRFVWLMGADNLAQFDQWKDWRQIMETTPIGIIARPDARLSPLFPRGADISGARVPAKQSRLGAAVRPSVVLCEYAAYAHFFHSASIWGLIFHPLFRRLCMNFCVGFFGAVHFVDSWGFLGLGQCSASGRYVPTPCSAPWVRAPTWI